MKDKFDAFLEDFIINALKPTDANQLYQFLYDNKERFKGSSII